MIVKPTSSPLPPGARRLATRRDDEGRVLGCLLSTDLGPAALRDSWQAQGWHTRPVLGPAGEVRGVFCSRGKELLYAWLWPARPDKPTLVLLTALPAEVTE
jgi:hypothetical protein